MQDNEKDWTEDKEYATTLLSQQLRVAEATEQLATAAERIATAVESIAAMTE